MAEQQEAAGQPQAEQQRADARGNGVEGQAELLSLASQYRSEFESTFDGLRRRSQELQQSVHQHIETGGAELLPQKDAALAIIQDTSDVAAPSQLVLQSYLWSAILVASFGTASLLGTFLFSPLVTLLLGTYGLAAVAIVGIPTLGLFYLKQLHISGASDPEVRMNLVVLSILNGVAFGSLVSHRWLFAEPVACVYPLIIALAYAPAQKSLGSSRVHVLGALVGSALFSSLMLGLFTSSVCGPYLFHAVLLSAVSVLSLQFFFKTVQTENDVPVTHLHQLAYLFGVILAKSLSYGLISHEY